jgi:hypothetical protein
MCTRLAGLFPQRCCVMQECVMLAQVMTMNFRILLMEYYELATYFVTTV